jgi:molecular chaperone GrpE
MPDENNTSAPGTDPNNGTGASADNGSPDLTALQQELEDTKNKLSELTLISQHALADLQNFKKRTEEDKEKFVIFANSTLISSLLPVLDNLDRALLHLPEEPASREWANGMLAIMKQLEDTLKKQGLEQIPSSGQKFDPVLHEAVMTEPGEQDRITREMEKGYRIQNKVLRRAKVIVGNGNPGENHQSGNQPENAS